MAKKVKIPDFIKRHRYCSECGEMLVCKGIVTEKEWGGYFHYDEKTGEQKMREVWECPNKGKSSLWSMLALKIELHDAWGLQIRNGKYL